MTSLVSLLAASLLQHSATFVSDSSFDQRQWEIEIGSCRVISCEPNSDPTFKIQSIGFSNDFSLAFIYAFEPSTKQVAIDFEVQEKIPGHGGYGGYQLQNTGSRYVVRGLQDFFKRVKSGTDLTFKARICNNEKFVSGELPLPNECGLSFDYSFTYTKPEARREARVQLKKRTISSASVVCLRHRVWCSKRRSSIR